MPVVTTAEYVVMLHIYGTGPTLFRSDPDTILPVFLGDSCPDPASSPEYSWLAWRS